MITQEDYKRQKKLEIDCLSSFTGKPYSLNTFSPDEVFAVKEEIKIELQKQAIDTLLPWGETNCSPFLDFEFHDHHFRYTYQREDLHAEPQTLFSKTYNFPLPKEVDTAGFYTNCGMSAISGTLFTIASIFPNTYHLYCDEDTYFETRLLIKHHIPSLLQAGSNGTGPYLYIVDTSAVPDIDSWTPKIEASKNGDLSIVIIDTTCYPLQSHKIQNFVEIALQKNVLVVLVRSHEKLDFMAMEYSRLGSANFIYNNTLPDPTKRKISTLIEGFKQTMALLGLNFSLTSIPPFLTNKEFHEINATRIQRSAQNNLEIAIKLNAEITGKTPFSVKRSAHNLFFCINFNNFFSDKKLFALEDNLVKILSKNNIPTREVASFAFDFIAIIDFALPNEDKLLRFSIPDFPSENIAKCVSIIASAVIEASRDPNSPLLVKHKKLVLALINFLCAFHMLLLAYKTANKN